MRKNHIPLIVLMFFSFLISSCREEFTEQDALNLINKIDLAIFVYNRSLNESQPVQGAKVVMVQGEESREVLTDPNGIAFFPDAKFGGLFYSVEAENYTTHYKETVISSANGNINEETISVGLYSLSDENLAIIKGKLLIEKDLTNDTAEFASSVTLNLRVELEEGEYEFRTTSDVSGNFEFRVPAEKNGSSTILRIPDVELNQRIAIMKRADENIYFPDVLPRIVEVPTVFSLNTSFLRNHDNYPVQEIPTTYGIADPASDGMNDAIIREVYINSDGEVNGLEFYSGGFYEGEQDGVVAVNFYSLNGGIGGYMEFNLLGRTSLNQAYFTGDYVLQGGSGYSDENYKLNRIPYRPPSPVVGDNREKYLGYIMPGSQTIINIDYGTGIYRPYDYDYVGVRDDDI